jgi:DNA-binding NarL/FixJ family response regulator
MKKILIADDHAMVREGLVAIINKHTPHTVVAQVSDGIEAIEQVRQTKPDLVILDIGMPGLNGLESLRQIKKIDRSINIIILSVHKDKNFVITAIRLGASGYLLKIGAARELFVAIEEVLQGKRYLSPALSDMVAEEILGPSQKKDMSSIDALTFRESQILSLIAGGFRRPEIADRLHISHDTVKTHRKNIMAKLGIHKLSGLIKFARDHNLGPMP